MDRIYLGRFAAIQNLRLGAGSNWLLGELSCQPDPAVDDQGVSRTPKAVYQRISMPRWMLCYVRIRRQSQSRKNPSHFRAQLEHHLDIASNSSTTCSTGQCCMLVPGTSLDLRRPATMCLHFVAWPLPGTSTGQAKPRGRRKRRKVGANICHTAISWGGWIPTAGMA